MVDCAGFGRAAQKAVRGDDLWFVFKHFVTTPNFYYLPATEHRFVALDHANTIARKRPERIWLVSTCEIAPPPAWTHRDTQPIPS